MSMARKPNEALTLKTTIDNVHAWDVIRGKHDRVWMVERVERKNLRRTLTVRDIHSVMEVRTDTYDFTHEVEVQAEHKCQCNGTGRYYGHGHVENGVFRGTVGECFGCHGKGWQDRADVIRNHTYWNKYARV